MPNEILQGYLKRCRRKHITPRTVEQYRSVLERFLKAVAFPAAGIDAIEDYFGRIAERYSTGTVRLHAAILSGFFNWCVRHGHIERNYVKHNLTPIPCEFVKEYDNFPFHKQWSPAARGV